MIDYKIYKNKKTQQTIVLLHGWGQSKESMEPLKNLLKNRYTIINIDLPGFGNSPLEKPYVIEDYIKDLEELFALHLINPTLIIGHSFGGKLATYYALKHPCPILLLAPSIIKPMFSLKVFLKIKVYKFFKLLKRVKIIKRIPTSFLGSNDYKSSTGVLRKTFLNVVHSYPNKEIKDLGTNMHVIIGKEDKTIDSYQAKKIHKYNSKAKVIILEGDHFAYLNNKHYISKYIDEIIKECNK